MTTQAGTYIYPPVPIGPTITAPDGVVLSIDSALWVCRNGTRTNGQALAGTIDDQGRVFFKSPNAAKGLRWYEWQGSATANKWRDTGTADDPTGNANPVVSFLAVVWNGDKWIVQGE